MVDAQMRLKVPVCCCTHDYPGAPAHRGSVELVILEAGTTTTVAPAGGSCWRPAGVQPNGRFPGCVIVPGGRASAGAACACTATALLGWEMAARLHFRMTGCGAFVWAAVQLLAKKEQLYAPLELGSSDDDWAPPGPVWED
jgi:hypothetical protein